MDRWFGPCPRLAAGEVCERGQETRERLAAAGRRDQKGVAPRPGQFEQRELMGMGAPAARLEPGGEGLGDRLKRRPGDQAPACAHSRPLTFSPLRTNSGVIRVEGRANFLEAAWPRKREGEL